MVDRLRSDFRARQRRAGLTNESASSSSSSSTGGRWPTPSASLTNDQEDIESFLARQAVLKEKGINGNGAGIPLTVAARMWPTPRSSPNENRTTKPAPSHGNGHGSTLAGEAVAAMWPSASARDWKGAPDKPWGDNARPLNEVAKTWGTPSTMAANGRGYTRDGGVRGKERLALTGQATSLSPPPVRQSGSAGARSSSGGHGSHRLSLNPSFVEWLMGWPPGWTDCGSPVMAFTHWLQRQRTALSALNWNYAAPPDAEPPAMQMELI